MWVGMIGATINLETACDNYFYLLLTGDLYLLIGYASPDQTGRKNLEIRGGRSPGFFALVLTLNM